MKCLRFRSPARRWIAAAVFTAAPFVGHAADSISDPLGDFLPTFGGSSSSADLDVIGATVTYNGITDVFTFSGTMAGAIGSTPNGLYVWGINKGAGVAGFAANGITGVLFDAVLQLRPNGTGSIGANNLPAGAVTIAGNTITGVVSGALLPSTGFGKANYTFNLWPRNTSFAGFAAISDFAPNNSNFTAIPVPEPASAALMALGVAGMLAWRRRSAASAR
jgi:hypothetical protein